MATYGGAPTIVTDGLVFAVDAANYESYPGSGTTWSDMVGGNDGTLTNGPTFDGANGGSIAFDGSNDHMLNNSSTQYDLTEATIECWVNIPQSTNNYFSIFSLFERNPYRGFGLNRQNSSTKFQFLVTYNSTGTFKYITANNSYELNTWYHVVGQLGPTSAHLYINNIQQSDSQSYTTAISPTSIPITIGRFYHDVSGYYGPCNIAIARLYNRALTPPEILQNYNALKSRFGL